MNILSLFDGLGGAYLACKQAGIPVTNYYSSEVDKWCNILTKAKIPEIIQLGDVRNVNKSSVHHEIDLLIGGSPCQKLSLAGGQKGLVDESALFHHYVRIKKEFNPKKFLFENVASMKDSDRDIISELLGVQPVMINSSLLTAQTRTRYYWTNIENISQPKDAGILLKDILSDYEEKYILTDKEIAYMYRESKDGRNHFEFNHCHDSDKFKSRCLPKNLYKGIPYNVLIDKRFGKTVLRKLTPLECEKLQGVPENWTHLEYQRNKFISNTQKYMMLGNGFTIPVISHILSFMKPNLASVVRDLQNKYGITEQILTSAVNQEVVIND